MYNNELYHFGVKGMKWGVRRELKKNLKYARYAAKDRNNTAISKYIQRDNSSGKNFDAVTKRKNSELNKHNKNSNVSKLIDAREKQIKEVAGNNIVKYDNIVRNDTVIKNLYSQRNKEQKQIVDSFIDDYRGAYLKDMGLNDTREGRRYLKRIGFR